MKSVFSVTGTNPLIIALLTTLEAEGFTYRAVPESRDVITKLYPSANPRFKHVHATTQGADVALKFTLPRDWDEALKSFQSWYVPTTKAGDWVVCTDTNCARPKGVGWKPGFTFQVDSLEETKTGTWLYPKTNGAKILYGINEEWVRPATKDDLRRLQYVSYKEGEWVTCIPEEELAGFAMQPGACYEPGYTFQISKTRSVAVDSITPFMSLFGTSKLSVHSFAVRPATPDEITAATNIDINDWVTCVSGFHAANPSCMYFGGSGYRELKTIQVKGIDNPGDDRLILWDEFADEGIYSNAVRKATPQEISFARTLSIEIGDHKTLFVVKRNKIKFGNTTFRAKELECVIDDIINFKTDRTKIKTELNFKSTDRIYKLTINGFTSNYSFDELQSILDLHKKLQ